MRIGIFGQHGCQEVGRLILVSLLNAVCLVGSASSQGENKGPAPSQSGHDPSKFEPSFVLSPSLSWINTTQNQTQFGGTTMVSSVRSRGFCDQRTRQFGVVGNASDSSTSNAGAAATVLADNDVRADALMGLGFGGGASPKLTQNYLSADADFFTNNGIGIGLQQEVAVNYQRYLRPCLSVLKPQRLFSSVSAGIGYINERLYATTSRVGSTVVPLSAQMSYIVTNIGQAPKLIISAQAGYTPLLNDMHGYQAYINGSVQIPTRFPFLTVSLNESDLYMNNAPTGYKRNYESGSIQLTLSFGGSTNTNGRTPGACYTADTLSHLYCYDQVASSECSPPSVFRPGGKCSASAIGPLNHPAPPDENR